MPKPSPSAPIRLATGTRTASNVSSAVGTAAQAHLVLDPGDLEPRRRDLDDEARQARVAGCLRVRIGHREDRQQVGYRAVADEALGARDDVVVPVADRPGADRPDVRAGLGLGHGERDEMLARCEPRQPALVLLRRAGHHDRQRRELVHGEDQAGRRARPAELLDRQADGQQVGVEAAVGRRKRQCQDVLRREQRAKVLRELAALIDVLGPRRDSLVGQGADGVAEERLLLGQSVAGLRRLGHRGHRSSGARRAGSGRQAVAACRPEAPVSGRRRTSTARYAAARRRARDRGSRPGVGRAARRTQHDRRPHSRLRARPLAPP